MGIYCVIGIAFTIETRNPQNIFVITIPAIICFLLVHTPTEKELARKKQRNEKKQLKQGQHAQSLRTCTMEHVSGLPLAEGVSCTISSGKSKFTFSSGTMKFELEKSKITDICITTDTDIQEQYVSSAGGAVGGAMLFGTVGAMIGGRAKKKTVKHEVHNYLIITYQSPDIKYIGFEIGPHLASAYQYIHDFNNTRTSSTTITL